MKRDEFLNKLQNQKPLVADGAMGTLLHARGIGFERCFDELNLTNPALVGSIHQEYIRAGGGRDHPHQYLRSQPLQTRAMRSGRIAR